MLVIVYWLDDAGESLFKFFTGSGCLRVVLTGCTRYTVDLFDCTVSKRFLSILLIYDDDDAYNAFSTVQLYKFNCICAAHVYIDPPGAGCQVVMSDVYKVEHVSSVHLYICGSLC